MMGKLYQFQTAITCSFGSFLMGILNVWPSYTTNLFMSPNTTLLSAPMTEMEVSLLGSLPSLGAMLGACVVGFMINNIGRKKTGLVVVVTCCVSERIGLVVLSWAMIQISSTSFLILLARLLGGISGGAFLVYSPIFISEIAEDSIRGTLASGPTLFYCFGTLVSYILGWLMPYNIVLWTNFMFSVGCVVLLTLVTESPVYLLKENREEEACASIAHYRGASATAKVVLDELSRLKQQLLPPVELIPVRTDPEAFAEEAEKEQLNYENNVRIEKPKMSAIKLLYVSPASRRAFIVVTTVMSLQVFMGMVPVQVYAKNLFATAAPSMSSHVCSVLFAVILLSGSFVATLIADKAGRRVLLLSSATVVSFSMAILGFLIQTNVAPAWVIAVIILIYCFFFIIGAGIIPYVLLAEVFVPEVQSVASILIAELVWFLNFVILAVFPFMTALIGIHGAFYVFAIISVADVVLGYLLVPETKGLSMAEIQEIFSRRRK